LRQYEQIIKDYSSAYDGIFEKKMEIK
jgi:hypothetical protein